MGITSQYLLLLLVKIVTVVFAQTVITFPQIDDFPTDCKLPNGKSGTCQNIRYCPIAQTARTEPQTCYFERFEHFVCCQESTFEEYKDRAANQACAKYHPNVLSVTSGKPTVYKEFPYMAALGWESVQTSRYDYKCGGVLISPKFVLTAAHCGIVNGIKPAVILPGGVNLTDSAVKPINIRQVTLHPAYDPTLPYHDIALIELARPVSDQTPCCLWTSFAVDKINVTAIGYGHTKFGGPPSDQLQKVFLQVVSNKDCESQYVVGDEMLPQGIIATQICAKDPENRQDTCQGDSGGPIVMQFISSLQSGKFRLPFSPGALFVVGITSFGQSCALGTPGVYTRVSEYIDWIEDIVWSNGTY